MLFLFPVGIRSDRKTVDRDVNSVLFEVMGKHESVSDHENGNINKSNFQVMNSL